MDKAEKKQRGLKRSLALGATSVAAALALAASAVAPASAGTSLLSWDLVDGGKHLDWDSNSIYTTEIYYAVNLWESHRVGVIRPDTASVVQDVFVSDYYQVTTTAGVTSSAGTLKLNKYRMQPYSWSQRRNLTSHEFGHALGLDHNTSADVMYKYVTSNTRLTTNDRASYNASYRRY